MLIVQEWLNCKLRMVLQYLISSSSLGIFTKMQCTSNQLMSSECLSLNCFIYKWVLKHSPYCFAFHLCSFLPAQFLGSQKFPAVALLDLLSSLVLGGVQSCLFLGSSAGGGAVPKDAHIAHCGAFPCTAGRLCSMLEAQPVTVSGDFTRVRELDS